MSMIEKKVQVSTEALTISVDALGKVQNPSGVFAKSAIPGIVPGSFQDAKAYALNAGLTVYQADLKGFRKNEESPTFDLGA